MILLHSCYLLPNYFTRSFYLTPLWAFISWLTTIRRGKNINWVILSNAPIPFLRWSCYHLEPSKFPKYFTILKLTKYWRKIHFHSNHHFRWIKVPWKISDISILGVSCCEDRPTGVYNCIWNPLMLTTSFDKYSNINELEQNGIL